MTRQVVITGVGVIAANGTDTESFWKNCLNDVAVVENIPQHWLNYSDFNSSLWAPLPEIPYSDLGFNRMEIMQRDPVTLLATLAAQQAIENAELETSLINKRKNNFNIHQIDNNRAGVFIGTGSGGYTTLLSNHAQHILHRAKSDLTSICTETSETNLKERLNNITKLFDIAERFNPFGVPMSMVNAVSASIGIKFNIHGPNHTLAQACASGTVAIGHAFQAVKSGLVDFAITGGCEYLSPTDGGEYRGFDVSKTLVRNCSDPKKANRPFDESRSGFLFSQGGAAALTIETREHAEQRGAPILAEIAGFAETFDADNLLSIDSEGKQIERMLKELLQQGDISTEQVDYINAHGTGTELNDKVESDIISRIFPHKPLVNATKSLIGHTFGASGAIEAAVCALSLRDQTTHICHNLEQPIADLNFVRQQQTENINYAINESFAFGGHNVGLLLKSNT
jgi:3-oxoacyl-[acyl-carrier-protein] synthase II